MGNALVAFAFPVQIPLSLQASLQRFALSTAVLLRERRARAANAKRKYAPNGKDERAVPLTPNIPLHLGHPFSWMED
jgi:hypothetical protein